MELRIAAHLSQDPNMLAAFRNGDDLHRLLAQRVLGRTEITKEERSRMKPVNFGFLFDADPYTYEQTMLTDYDIVVPRSESKMLHAAFHSQWAGLRPWYTRTVSTAFDQGYVRAEDGRVRRVQNMRSESPREQQNARRQIINFPVQELGLTLGGLMVVLATGNGLKVVRFVHDSCDVEVLDDPQHIENAATIFKRMEQVIPQILKSKFGIEFSVPIIIDVEGMGR
jgi:DNA polymerase-1